MTSRVSSFEHDIGRGIRYVISGLFRVCLVAAVFYLEGGCSPSDVGQQEDGADRAPALRLGYRPAALADIAPVVIKEAGITSPSVDLRLIPISSPPDGWNKFKSNEVDALAGMPLASVFDQLGGTGPQRPFVAYFLQADLNGRGWVAIVGSKKLGISSLTDLAGKTVATLNTDQAEWLMRRILLSAGIPKDQIRIVRYNPATPLIGLRNSEHAAIFGLEPALAEALYEGNPVLWRGPVSHFLYADRPVPVSASIVAVDWRQKNPKGFAEFSRMNEEAVKLTNEQSDRVRGFFQKTEYGGLKPEVTELLSLPVMVKPDAGLKEITEQYINDMIRENVLKQKIDPSPLFPDSTGQ